MAHMKTTVYDSEGGSLSTRPIPASNSGVIFGGYMGLYRRYVGAM